MQKVKTVWDVYSVTNRVIQLSIEQGYTDIAQKLDDAKHLGSSGLEIIGAIGSIFLSEKERILELIEKKEFKGVVRFVNKAYGSS